MGIPDKTLLGILKLFYNEYGKIREQTRSWIEREDNQALAAYVHKLKGSTGSLQMQALRQELIQLETQLKSGATLSVDDFAGLYAEMDQVIKRYQLDKIADQP